MINIPKILLYCISLLLCTSSCNKNWLDEKADRSLAFPATVQELQAIIDDVSTFNSLPFNSLILNEIAADGHYYTDLTFQDFSPYIMEFQNAYTWTAKLPFEQLTDIYKGYYTFTYSTIANCNVVLAAKQGDNNQHDFMNVQAQARFVRAFAYYTLAQSYAPPYNAATASQTPGLQLRMSTDITETINRSSVESTYKQIIDDLKAAVEYLPDIPNYITRAGKPAALGLLARVYLTMGDFTNAFHYANEYLKIKHSLLDHSTISANAEVIGLNSEVAYLGFINIWQAPFALGNTYLVDQDLIDSYDENDLRKTTYFTPTTGGVTFKGTFTDRNQDIFCGIATDEMYLIRAECYARANNVLAAMKDLNDLLRSRWAKKPDGTTTYTDAQATDETDALQRIFNERKKQLILRGVRWTDLRRLNTDTRFAITLTRYVQGKSYTLLPNSRQYTFPIPQIVIDRTGIPQNPAWD